MCVEYDLMGKPFVDLMQSQLVNVLGKADYCSMILCIDEQSSTVRYESMRPAY